MLMRIHSFLMATTLLLIACGGDPDQGREDSGNGLDAGTRLDGSTGTPDASDDGGDTIDADLGHDSGAVLDADTRADSGDTIDADVLDASLIDASTLSDAALIDGSTLSDAATRIDAGRARDAGTSASSLGPVQCRVSSDCRGPVPTCVRTTPGGVCNGCTDGTCPSGTFCNDFGACARPCDSNTDCNLGMACLPSGMCGIRTCGPSDPCPAPYECGVRGSCVRPSCDRATPCPAPLVCNSLVCVEP
jgi:hypothetical protein